MSRFQSLRHIHLATWMSILGGLCTLLGSALLWGQALPQASCDSQVQEQYRQLVADQILSASAVSWGDQLTSITGELRLSKTQLELKQGQLSQAERNLAVLVERQRQLTQVQARLQAEVEQLKNATPQAEKPPQTN